MNDLATRLRQLLDVMQRVHGVKRSVAERLIGDAVGVSPRYISNLATNCVRVGFRNARTLDYGALSELETKYAFPLALLRRYEAACARRAA